MTKLFISSIAAFLIVPLMVGTVLAGTALPAAVMVRATVDAGLDTWNAIEVDPSVFDVETSRHIRVTDRDGNQIALFYDEDREPIASLDEVAPVLVDAVISTEDRRFFDGEPIDLIGTARALVTGRGGGSGIVQQQAKLLCAASGECVEGDGEGEAMSDRTLNRKLVEMKYATELVSVRSTDEILTDYLNTAYFGNGAYGVSAAARRYFGTTPDKLTLDQSAMVAGLLKSPIDYDPLVHPEAAMDRRDTVLLAMVENGKATRESVSAFLGEPVITTPEVLPNGCSVSSEPYFCDWIYQILLTDKAFGQTEEIRAENLRKGGFTVRTSLDQRIQDIAESNLSTNFSSDTVVAADVVIRPGYGDVLAAASSTSYSQTQYNIPVDASLQPGSVFKPVTLAAAYDSGVSPAVKISGASPYTPASGVAPEGGFQNLYGISYGDVDSVYATRLSLNTWFVRLAEMVGTRKIADTAYSMGMGSMNPDSRTVGDMDLSLTLGAFETSVLDMANVYATLAAEGVACKARPILEVTELDSDEVIHDFPPQCHQAISRGAALTVTRDLTGPQQAGGSAESISVPGQDWRGKTGTTSNFGATWFAGYTANYASAVWLGDLRGPSYPVADVLAFGKYFPEAFGSDIAAPLWAESMSRITEGTEQARFPSPVAVVPVTSAFPDVTGLSVNAALGVLQSSGVDLRDVSLSSQIGTVRSQVPEAGAPAWGLVELEVVE